MNECYRLMALGEAEAAEAEGKATLQDSWSALIDECIELLQQRRNLRPEADQTRATSLREQLCELQMFLSAGDMGAAKKAYQKLKQSMNGVDFNQKVCQQKIGSPPSRADRRAMKLEVLDTVKSMELRYQEALAPRPIIVMLRNMYLRVRRWIIAAGRLFKSYI